MYFILTDGRFRPVSFNIFATCRDDPGVSTLAMLGHVGGVDALPILAAIAMFAAAVQLARPLLKPAANDSPLIARTV